MTAAAKLLADARALPAHDGESLDRAHDMTTLTSRSPTLRSLPVARRPRIARRELEFDEVALAMESRLALGASRIGQARAAAAATACARRADQARVFADFATYLTDVATRPPAEQRPPFCRIILPSRTGKTVVAGHIIDRAELAATFIVPTRTLLEQTVRERARQLPGVADRSGGAARSGRVVPDRPRRGPMSEPRLIGVG